MFTYSFAKGILTTIIVTTVVNSLLNHLIAPVVVDSENSSFDPSVTDVLNYGSLMFVKPGETMELDIGIWFFFFQVMPRWVSALMEKIHYSNQNDFQVAFETTIFDARKATGIDFVDSGFTLVDMKEDLSTIETVESWRGQNGGIQDFQKKLEVYLHKLLPSASRFEFTYNVVRGGSTFGDQPAAIDGPHLDYSQDDARRKLFHKKYPPHDMSNEHHALLGRLNTEDEEVTALLGVWKPVLMNTPVCDHPLAVMDARTFLPQHETPMPLHMNFGIFTFHNLNGAIHYDPDQKWYYYPFQNKTEVLVFHQYSKGRYHANPHTSFKNPNCPSEGYDSRISVEMRVAVFEKKKKKKD